MTFEQGIGDRPPWNLLLRKQFLNGESAYQLYADTLFLVNDAILELRCIYAHVYHTPPLGQLDTGSGGIWFSVNLILC